MRRFIFALTLLLVSCDIKVDDKALLQSASLEDDLTGFWTISQAIDTVAGVQHSCQNTTFKIIQTQTLLSFSGRTFSCANGSYQTIRAPIDLQINGENLLFGNAVIGTKSSQVIIFNISLPTGGAWQFTMFTSKNQIKYTESSSNSSSTSGILKRG